MSLFLRNLLFTLVVPGTVAGLVPWWFASKEEHVALAPWLALPLFAVGIAIYLWCAWDFAAFGRGTPSPSDAPRRLVVRGLFRWSRNPIYVGVLTIIAGWYAWTGVAKVGLWGVAMAVMFHLRVVFYEEPHLAELFGEEYARYRARVGRWITLRPR